MSECFVRKTDLFFCDGGELEFLVDVNTISLLTLCEKLDAVIRTLDLSLIYYSRTMTTLGGTSVLAKLVERFRNALQVEMTSGLVITAKIDGECFEIRFSTGESAVLSK